MKQTDSPRLTKRRPRKLGKSTHISGELRSQLPPVLKQHGIIRAALFGSFARGEAKRDSDLDVLVEFKKWKSLLDLVALKLALEEVTGRKVDVVTYRSLHPRLRERILKDQIIVL